MYAKNRMNPRGLQFHLMQLSDGITEIRYRSKKITVNHDIERISQGWYDWCIGGCFIQSAFDFLSPSEREFLMTGITPEEWEATFTETEETEEKGLGKE